MAGADIAVTDARVADLVLEYAMHLGRAGMTDTVVIPVARNGRAEEASLLIGPASQIALTDNDDPAAELIELPDVDEVLAEMQQRLDSLVGRRGHAIVEDGGDAGTTFADFDTFSG